LRSAPKGTGVIAGGPVRAIMMAAGVKDVVAKSLGSSNPVSTSRAVMEAFAKQKSASLVSKLRGKSFSEMFRR
jgi:small subunit ribosomal protein S5